MTLTEFEVCSPRPGDRECRSPVPSGGTAVQASGKGFTNVLSLISVLQSVVQTKDRELAQAQQQLRLKVNVKSFLVTSEICSTCNNI